jgi:hypothetical protein
LHPQRLWLRRAIWPWSIPSAPSGKWSGRTKRSLRTIDSTTRPRPLTASPGRLPTPASMSPPLTAGARCRSSLANQARSRLSRRVDQQAGRIEAPSAAGVCWYDATRLTAKRPTAWIISPMKRGPPWREGSALILIGWMMRHWSANCAICTPPAKRRFPWHAPGAPESHRAHAPVRAGARPPVPGADQGRCPADPQGLPNPGGPADRPLMVVPPSAPVQAIRG